MCEISERIYQAGMQRGIQQGIQQGIQKGIQAGAVSKSQTVVRNMFLRGMSAVDASVICEEKLELVEAWFREWE